MAQIHGDEAGRLKHAPAPLRAVQAAKKVAG